MSAKSGNRYLLVVTVLTGRNFPQRPSDSLRIDVRFDGQLLSSLPVPMAEEPVFDMDMAFRLTGKQLKDHKVQRTPIKIDVMKVNRKTKKSEKIGYQTLDLRSYAVEVSRPRFSWFPLLGAQQLRGKPELHLGVSVDEDVEAENSARSQKEFTRSARNKEYWMQHQPVLVNNPDGTSHYQLGPSKDSTHIYMISVTIGYAANIDKFFDRISRPPPVQPRDFFFHYELVSNHLTTKPFSDFESSDLAAERISLRLKTHYGLMKDYFLHEKSLKIKLCQGEGHIIASADFLFDDAFKPEVSELTENLRVEKEVVLHPFPENRFGIPEELVIASEDWPVVGVQFEISVVNKLGQIDLRRTLTLDSANSMQSEIEDFLQNSRRASAKVPVKPAEPSGNIRRSRSSQNLDRRKTDRSSRERPPSVELLPSPEAQFKYSKTSTNPTEAERPRNERARNGNKENSQPQSLNTDPAPKENGPSRVYERSKEDEFGQGDAPMWKYPKTSVGDKSNGHSENGRNGSDREEKRRTQRTSSSDVSPPSIVPHLNATGKEDQYKGTKPTSSNSQPNGLTSAMDKLNLRPPSSFGDEPRSSPPQLSSDVTRRYICTIFLYKIRIISANCRHPIPVYLRYQYPFFGSAAPIMTRPAIEVQPKIETVLDNNSLTHFTFGCSESQLLRAFRTAPVCVEVWKSGMGNVQDELIGQAKVRLDQLYRAAVTTLYENEKPYSRRLYDDVLEVIDLQSEKYTKLAELTICTTLDDYGSVQRTFIDTISPPSSVKESVRETVKPDVVMPAPSRPVSNKLDVEELRRDAVFELEVWREREEKKFKAQLKQREEDAMKYMTEEWERRSKQQKAYVEEVIERNRNLESDLRKSLLESNQKEVSLKERERRVNDAERFVKAEKAKLTQEIEEMQDNVIKEYSKRLELEHSAQGLLKAEIRQLQGQVEDFRKVKTDQEEVIKRYQDAERQKPFQHREAQSEIDRLTLDKNDLERRCAAITESKEHYKQQWQMALKEITKMRDRVDSEHERRLNDKDREITNLRMELERAREPWNKGSMRSLSNKDRYYRENEKSVESSPRKQRLAMQFDNPRKTTLTSNGHSPAMDEDESEDHPAMDVNGLGLTDGEESDSENRIDSEDEDDDNPRKQLIRALEERNVLLGTKIYKLGDTVIVDLDKKIARLKSSLQ